MEGKNQQNMFRREYLGRTIAFICGISLIALTIAIGCFLLVRGTDTFTYFGHSVGEFLFSSNWKPMDTAKGGGHVGALIFIWGSILTCGLALLIAVPFSLATAIFMTKISPELGEKIVRPASEIFVGIPSVIYGWVGLVVLVPLIKEIFNVPYGQSVLAASIVLAVMIYPTITSVSADAINSVNPKYLEGAYGLGATRWQVIYSVLLPAAAPGIMTAVVLGLARAFGEALAVAMVIGKMKAFPTSLLSPTSNLTTAIASDMGGAMDGGEYSAALWSMALLLFIISLIFILIIHTISGRKEQKA
jgi:phosphate transport system permease protein